MKFYIKTFGCQMNVHDSTRIKELMVKSGHSPVNSVRESDVVIVNSCSVREKAWHKAISETGRYCKSKRKRSSSTPSRPPPERVRGNGRGALRR